MTLGQLIQIAIQYGLPTVLLFIMGWAYYRKDKSLTDALVAEQKARIDDAKAYHAGLMTMQGQLVTSVERTNSLMALVEKLRDASARPPPGYRR